MGRFIFLNFLFISFWFYLFLLHIRDVAFGALMQRECERTFFMANGTIVARQSHIINPNVQAALEEFFLDNTICFHENIYQMSKIR